MKKAENFDEIFAQRGEQVQPENMVKGEIYLLVRAPHRLWDMLIEFYCVQPEDQKVEVVTTGLLTNAQQYVFREPCYRGGVLKSDASAFFKATPDQVELLNSYRV